MNIMKKILIFLFFLNFITLLLSLFTYRSLNDDMKQYNTNSGIIFNVLDYGANPNDSKSDSAAVYKALEDAWKTCEFSHENVEILFPRGTYILDKSIEFSNNTFENISIEDTIKIDKKLLFIILDYGSIH
jgi:hypothetical protein